MARKSNQEVIIAFFNHQEAESGNMHSDGTRLYSYNTCMLEWHDNVVYVNTTKYSRTTSKQMSGAWRFMQNIKTIEVTGAKDSYSGLHSIYQFYRDNDPRIEAKRKRQQRFRREKARVDKFRSSIYYTCLSYKSQRTIDNILNNLRPNDYRKDMVLFDLIRDNVIHNYGTFQQRKELVLRRNHEPRPFSLSL